MSIARRWALAALAALVAACTDSSQSSKQAGGGTIVIAASADPNLLFPPLIVSTQARQIAEQIYDYLAVVGLDLNTLDDASFQPRLAQSWKWSSDSLSIAFRINPRARWHDGAPVDANDVRYTYQVYTNPKLGSPSAEELKNIDSVTVADPLTAVFWYHTRSSHQLLDATEMLILPRHVFEKVQIDSLAQFGAAATPVGTGRFRFKEWTRGSSLELVADTNNYRGRPGVDRVIWSVAPNAVTAVTKLFGGEADVVASVKSENIAELTRHSELRVDAIPGTDYYFMSFNLQKPLFASRELRRALTMAIDRVAIVKNVYDTLALPAIGPTVRVFPTTDPALQQIPFDRQRAEALLDSLGWKVSAATGVRTKGREVLAFTTLLPSSSSPRVRMAVLLQEQLRRVGVRMNIDQMEFNTFQSQLEARHFDAAICNWHLGATPTLRETWGGKSARQKKGLNYGAYENPRFDAEADSAASARDLANSRRHFTSAYNIIIDDAPAIWLSEPKTVMGLHRRIRTTAMRADAWWFGLADWTIRVSERIARDRVSDSR